MAQHDELMVPPHSIEMEQSVLGALLLDSAAAWDAVCDVLQAKDFYHRAHQAIFDAIAKLTNAGKPADVITVSEQLQMQGKADDVGGLKYLNDLAQSVPSPRNARQYAEVVADKALRRAVCAAAMQAREIAFGPGDTSALLDQVAGLFAAIQCRKGAVEPVGLANAVVQRTAHWEALANGTVTAGIPTGLETLDEGLSGGLKPGTLITLAARPGVGKTSLATQIGLNVARQGKPVLLLSLEMSAGELVDRLIANVGRVNLKALTTGKFDQEDWTRISEGVDEATRLPFYVDDQPALTLSDIRAKARKVQRENGLALMVIDYVQLCASTGTRDKRHHQIEQISRGLKALAKELDITILLLSQLNRASTQRDEPQLVDLKESGSIEEDADVVILLHPHSKLPDGNLIVAAIVAKNRQGRRFRVALNFSGSTQLWVVSCTDVSPSVGGRGKQT